jgi:hypothetical protein
MHTQTDETDTSDKEHRGIGDISAGFMEGDKRPQQESGSLGSYRRLVGEVPGRSPGGKIRSWPLTVPMASDRPYGFRPSHSSRPGEEFLVNG